MTKEQQFTKDYDKYLNAIFLYFYSRTNNRDWSKDLAQDTFIKAWNYIKDGNEVVNTKALLYKIANNTLVDWYRKKKSQSLETLIETGFEPVDTDASAEKESEVQNVLGYLRRLSDNDQQLILWRFVEGLSPKEISKNLNRNEKTISVMVHRAVARLKNLAAV